MSRAHSNLFNPSTLNGSCTTASGSVDKDVNHKNLSEAIDIYIPRPWGNTKCMGKCRGHYMKPEPDLKYSVQNLNKAAVKPPSVVIKERLQG